MLASFLIFFRESFEASMIVAIMLAYLRQIGRRDRFREVWMGIAAAVLIAFGGGAAVFMTIRTYDGSYLQTVIESLTYFLAAGILTYMTFWMQRQSSNLKKELHEKMAAAIDGGATLTLALIAFITVGREGLETVVFMIAIAFRTNPTLLGFGAVSGLGAGLSLSYAIYAAGRKINLQSFFTIMGTLLMLFAGGLLANGIEDFQQLGWLPFNYPLWNTGRILSENGTLGDILHSFFGYADSPTALQLFAYLAYMGIMLTYFRRSRPSRKTVSN